MSRITVVGLGPGNPDYLLSAARKRLEESEIILGSPRQIEDIQSLSLGGSCISYQKIQEILDFVKDEDGKQISILVSGDSGYYSLVPYLKRNMEEEFSIIPGLSSFQYLFSRLGENWQNYFVGSVHGRSLDYISKMKEENAGLVLLTDEENNPRELARKLYEASYRGIIVIVGENLSYENEKITHYEIERWQEMPMQFDMNVCICKKGENYAHL